MIIATILLIIKTYNNCCLLLHESFYFVSKSTVRHANRAEPCTLYTTFEFTFDVFDLSICIGRARARVPHVYFGIPYPAHFVHSCSIHFLRFGRLPFAVHTPTVAYESVEQNIT